MSTCAKRSVLNAGDRPANVRRSALAVQSAANQFQQRVLPHTGSTGRPQGGGLPRGRQLNHGSMGSGDPMSGLARTVNQLARDVANTLARPQGPVGWTGGRQPNGGASNGGGTGGSFGGSFPPPPGSFTYVDILVGTHEAAYTEPMVIPLPPNFTPVAVIAARIQAQSDITRYFRSGVACDWVPYGNRILLRSIDGMTVAPTPDPTILTYTFLYYGVINA